MLSKKEFLELIEFIQKQEEKQEIFLKALDTLSPGTYNDCFIYGEYENKLVSLIKKVMGDTNDELGYYLYEMQGINEDINYEYDKEVCPKDEQLNVLYYSLSSLYDYLVSHTDNDKPAAVGRGQLYFDFDTNEIKEIK